MSDLHDNRAENRRGANKKVRNASPAVHARKLRHFLMMAVNANGDDRVKFFRLMT
jgi:hypothetical protein